MLKLPTMRCPKISSNSQRPHCGAWVRRGRLVVLCESLATHTHRERERERAKLCASTLGTNLCHHLSIDCECANARVISGTYVAMGTVDAKYHKQLTWGVPARIYLREGFQKQFISEVSPRATAPPSLETKKGLAKAMDSC